MKTTHIYMVRHGESEGNKRRVFLGHSDLGLSEKGKLQAEKTAEYLSKIHADVIYSSDLSRAYETGLPTAKIKKLDIIKSERLREIFAGKWENQGYEYLFEKYAEDYGRFRNDIGNARCTDGESVRELQERIVDEIKRIVSEHQGESIFIFTHATPIRAARARFEGWDIEQMKDYPFPSNASATHIEYDGESFRVVEYGREDFLGELSTLASRSV